MNIIETESVNLRFILFTLIAYRPGVTQKSRLKNRALRSKNVFSKNYRPHLKRTKVFCRKKFKTFFITLGGGGGGP